MKITKDHDALAGKKRFVHSLTHSRRYLNDAQFLTPGSKTGVSESSQKTSTVKDHNVNETDENKTNKYQETKVYY